MRQEGEYVCVVARYHCARLEYCRAETVELKATGKKVQKMCMTDVYSTKLYGFRDHERLGSTWVCCPLCTIWLWGRCQLNSP